MKFIGFIKSALPLSIIDRYLLKEILRFFFITLFSFTGVLFIIRVIKLSSLIINKGVAATQILIVFTSIIPTFLEIALPLSSLLAVMFAFARLSGDSEVVVFRSCGVSLFRLLKPVVYFGFFVTFFGLITSNILKAKGFEVLSNTLFMIAKGKSTSALDEGIFNKLGNLTIYTDKFNHLSGDMLNVMIYDKREEQLKKFTFAKNGKIFSNKESKSIIFYLRDGETHELVKGKYIVTQFNTNSISLSVDELYDPEAFKKGKSARELSNNDINQSLKELNQISKYVNTTEPIRNETLSPLLQQVFSRELVNKKSVDRKIARMSIEKNLRFSLPFASFFLALIALPLGIYPPRLQKTWGVGVSATIGLCVFVVYYALLTVGMTLSENLVLSAKITSWISNIVTVPLTFIFLIKLSNDTWESIPQTFEKFFNMITLRRRQ
jgi:lipopolysaccharide export system permease protein